MVGETGLISRKKAETPRPIGRAGRNRSMRERIVRGDPC